jgi:phosphatidate cytidylyltransferase
LITCIIVTDLAGYFVGRIIGGPKIWPFVSPNKTWSGLIGGWVCAVLIGLIFKISFDLSYLFVFLSLITSISSQVGDFYESWLKRRINKKDSSQLIPGHGGFMDRFDGFIGGALGFKVCLLFINPELVFV